MKIVIKLLLIVVWTASIQPIQAQQYQDCSTPFQLCSLKSYHISDMEGHGAVFDDITDQRCFEGRFKETNAFWFSWEIQDPGILGFIIDPKNSKDDFDFVLFRATRNDCKRLEEIRCVTTGLNHTSIAHENEDCSGQTGLVVTSLDEFESAGCKYNDDNYVKLVRTETNEKYYLLINNYNSSDGFDIHFSGNTILKTQINCSEFEAQSSLEVLNLYPNPASELINVDYISRSTNPVDVKIIDFLGRTIQQYSITATTGKNIAELDVKALAKGNYFMHLVQDHIAIVKSFNKN